MNQAKVNLITFIGHCAEQLNAAEIGDITKAAVYLDTMRRAMQAYSDIEALEKGEGIFKTFAM